MTASILVLMPTELAELSLTPTPFYINEVFRRLCKPCWECDYCCFCAEEEDSEEDVFEGRVCPESLTWYVTKRQKVIQAFDASHPPICPHCGKLMTADRTITLGDKDVTAFSCNHCHKIERSSRFCIEWDREELAEKTKKRKLKKLPSAERGRKWSHPPHEQDSWYV